MELVRRATPEDGRDIASRIRSADRREALDYVGVASHGPPAARGQEGGHDGRPGCRGVPQVMLGVEPVIGTPNMGIVWLVATKELENNRKAQMRFLRASRAILERLQEQYPILGNYVDERNELPPEMGEVAGLQDHQACRTLGMEGQALPPDHPNKRDDITNVHSSRRAKPSSGIAQGPWSVTWGRCPSTSTNRPNSRRNARLHSAQAVNQYASQHFASSREGEAAAQTTQDVALEGQAARSTARTAAGGGGRFRPVCQCAPPGPIAQEGRYGASVGRNLEISQDYMRGEMDATQDQAIARSTLCPSRVNPASARPSSTSSPAA